MKEILSMAKPGLIERLLTPEEVADVLKTSVKTVHRRIKSGALPSIQDGRVVRIHPTDLRTYIAARRRS
jgi:excisionase family DNA binding protein